MTAKERGVGMVLRVMLIFDAGKPRIPEHLWRGSQDLWRLGETPESTYRRGPAEIKRKLDNSVTRDWVWHR